MLILLRRDFAVALVVGGKEGGAGTFRVDTGNSQVTSAGHDRAEGALAGSSAAVATVLPAIKKHIANRNKSMRSTRPPFTVLYSNTKQTTP